MKRFKNILCHYSITDGSAAINRAVQLAKENKAKLTVVEVIKDLPKKYDDLRHTRMKELYRNTIKESKSHLEKIIAPLKKKGLNIQYKVLLGIPFLEIIHQVLRGKHDLVLTTVHEKSNLKEKLFGTTAIRLIRKCPCPVWAIKSSHTKNFNRILAAVDPDPMNAKKTSLNHKIIELATSLAQKEKSDLTVAHCWSKYPEILLGFGYTDLPPKEVDHILKETKAIHQNWLDEFMKKVKLQRKQCSAKLIAGDPGDQLPKLAKREKVELIVMGTVCRVGIPGLLIGNTAEKVLDRVNCSLLTIKPDGFKTPIKLS